MKTDMYKILILSLFLQIVAFEAKSQSKSTNSNPEYYTKSRILNGQPPPSMRALQDSMSVLLRQIESKERESQGQNKYIIELQGKIKQLEGRVGDKAFNEEELLNRIKSLERDLAETNKRLFHRPTPKCWSNTPV